MTLEIILYVIILVLFPFIVQICLIPVLFIADLFEFIIEKVRKERSK